MRDEEPDIDVDFDSDRREEVIQYVFDKYGRENAAQVANVVSYRPKFAVRDMAKAFGASPGQQDAWSKQVERWGALISSEQDHDIPAGVVDLALEVMKFPRHLGIHSGGMVLTDRPVGEVVPIEHARMEKRTVVQWDKDDCAWMGLVKFDLLGLGMLSAIQYTFDLVRDHLGEDWTLATIPREEPGVYDQLCRADSVGVFQVESRAQMGLLPRLQPRKFYDLVVEIALVRPGPIQGGAVHPFVRRKLGYEPITYLHPKLEEPLKRTLGVPIFQEQLMQVAMAVGGCTGDDADLLRRAMGSKRGIERIDSLRDKLYAGMAENGIIGAEADSIYAKIQAFAGFGFAESHALSFGLLVYASAWLRLHYPAAFLASLLRAQPMGFYSPQSLISDARRHGVRVLRPDLQRSLAWSTIEDDPDPQALGNDTCVEFEQPPIGDFDASHPVRPVRPHPRRRIRGAARPRRGERHRREARGEDRRGAGPRRRIRRHARPGTPGRTGDQAARGARRRRCVRLLRARAPGGDVERRQRRAGSPGVPHRHRRRGAAAAVRDADARWMSCSPTCGRPGVSTDSHPVEHVRPVLTDRGILSSADLRVTEPGRRVEVGRGGHAPAASGDRQRHHVPEPRGRDRASRT